MNSDAPKRFLILQGPHGPFFRQLGEMLQMAGHKVAKVGFNAGDEYYSGRKIEYIKFDQELDSWSAYFAELVEDRNISDIVLYGDTRPVHAKAVEIARTKGITVHCFEEGYLRPHWITYERGGNNGYSPLMQMDMKQIAAKRAARHVDLKAAPARWGNLWHHVWYGFRFHLALAMGMRRYKHYHPHRDISIWREVYLNAKRLILLPWQSIKRDMITSQFLAKGHPFSVVMLQLEHDASLRFHSKTGGQKPFIEDVVAGFSKNAPRHHMLVFKLHPLDDGRAPLVKWINEAARENGVSGRVLAISGGKLGTLIAAARSALSINSTSVQQAMWRGMPVKLVGTSIFAQPEFASAQSMADFMKAPEMPSRESFLEFRSYILETSQIVGGYYTQAARADAMRVIADMMLSKDHPYDHSVN